jgi:hypothetical protein
MASRAILLLVAALSAAYLLQADSGPQPPCGAKPFPPYPDQEGTPAVKVWERSDWTPTACTGWSPSTSVTLVVTVARFHYTGGAEGLRRRIGAVSEMSGWLYWSTTHQQWQPLIVDAYALAAPDGERRRKDFMPDEIVKDGSLHVMEEDSLLGKVTYELRIGDATADRLAFNSENSSAVRYFGLTILQPGEIQSFCLLNRESKDIWQYYNITRMAKAATVLTLGHPASLINRAVAYYRYLAGIPANQEPPAAR